jgi:hypothetical protein
MELEESIVVTPCETRAEKERRARELWLTSRRALQSARGYSRLDDMTNVAALRDYCAHVGALWLTLPSQASHSTYTFLELNDDCVLAICEWFTVAELLAFAAVCKGWRCMLTDRPADALWRSVNRHSARQWLLKASPYSVLIGVAHANPCDSAYEWRAAYQRGFAADPALSLGYALRCVVQLIDASESFEQFAIVRRWERQLVHVYHTHIRALKIVYVKLLATGAEAVYAHTKRTYRPVTVITRDTIEVDTLERKYAAVMRTVYASSTAVRSFFSSHCEHLLAHLTRHAESVRNFVRAHIVRVGYVEAFTKVKGTYGEDGSEIEPHLLENNNCLRKTVAFIRANFSRKVWFPLPCRPAIVEAMQTVELRRMQRLKVFDNHLQRLWNPNSGQTTTAAAATVLSSGASILGKRKRPVQSNSSDDAYVADEPRGNKRRKQQQNNEMEGQQKLTPVHAYISRRLKHKRKERKNN